MTRESSEGKLKKKTSVCRHQAGERSRFPAKEVGDGSWTTAAEKAPGTPADPKCGHSAGLAAGNSSALVLKLACYLAARAPLREEKVTVCGETEETVPGSSGSSLLFSWQSVHLSPAGRLLLLLLFEAVSRGASFLSLLSTLDPTHGWTLSLLLMPQCAFIDNETSRTQ